MQTDLLYQGFFDDNTVRLLYERIQKDGKTDTLFYAGGVSTLESFTQLVRDTQNCTFFLALCDGEVVGCCWLNGWEDYTARFHYIFFKEFYRKCLRIAEQGLKLIFEMERPDGTPLVKTLVGITPRSNRLAVRFLKKSGFTIVGEIPHLCLVGGVTEPGILSYKCKEQNG